MSNYANLIRDNLSVLCHNTVLTVEFLDHCVTKGVFTKFQAEQLNSEKTTLERNYKFFGIIDKKRDLKPLISIMAEPKYKEDFVQAIKILGISETSSGEAASAEAETSSTTPIVRKQKKSVQFNSAEPENIPRWPSIASEEDLEEVNL